MRKAISCRKMTGVNSLANYFFCHSKCKKYLMNCNSDDLCTSPLVCTVGCGQSRFSTGGSTFVCHPPEVQAFYRPWPCVCRFVHVVAVLHFTISFAPCHWRWTKGGAHMHWDIKLVISALASLVTHGANCSNFFWWIHAFLQRFIHEHAAHILCLPDVVVVLLTTALIAHWTEFCTLVSQRICLCPFSVWAIYIDWGCSKTFQS